MKEQEDIDIVLNASNPIEGMDNLLLLKTCELQFMHNKILAIHRIITETIKQDDPDFRFGLQRIYRVVSTAPNEESNKEIMAFLSNHSQ